MNDYKLNITSIIMVFIMASCSQNKLKAKEDTVDKNLNLVFQIIASIGSIATFGSFVYLFRRDQDKQAQIDKLANIVTTLISLKDIETQKLNLSVRPDIKFEGCGYQGQSGRWNLDITNIGEKATITELELISDGLALHNENIPYVMEKGTSRKIFAKTNTSQHVQDCDFILNVFHSDKIGNLHISVFQGKGSQAKLVETRNCI